MQVLLLHGIGGTAAGFVPHVDWFYSNGIEAHAMDQAGYGSAPLVEPYTFDALALQISNRVAAQTEETIIVGHSMGGMLAQLVAKSKPDNLAGMVLANSSPAFGNNNGDFQKRFISDRTAMLDAGQSMRDVANFLVPKMVGPHCTEAIRQRCVDMMSSVPEGTYRKALTALVQFDARPFLSEMTLPTLCLAAEYDVTAPPVVLEKLAEKLPNARYECLPTLGHLAPLEDTEKFCTAVLQFIKSIGASR